MRIEISGLSDQIRIGLPRGRDELEGVFRKRFDGIVPREEAVMCVFFAGYKAIIFDMPQSFFLDEPL